MWCLRVLRTWLILSSGGVGDSKRARVLHAVWSFNIQASGFRSASKKMFPPSFLEPFRLLLLATLFSSLVGASPTRRLKPEAYPSDGVEAKRDLFPRTVTILSNADISSYSPFTQFARAAYCGPERVKTWTCGGKSSAAGNSVPTIYLASRRCFRRLQCKSWFPADVNWRQRG